MEGTNIYYYCVECNKPLYKPQYKVIGFCEVCFLKLAREDKRYKKGKK